MTKREKLTIEFTPDLRDVLTRWAAEEGRTLSNLVRRLVVISMASNRPSHLKLNAGTFCRIPILKVPRGDSPAQSREVIRAAATARKNAFLGATHARPEQRNIAKAQPRPMWRKPRGVWLTMTE